MCNALGKGLQWTLNCLLQKKQDGYCVYVSFSYVLEETEKTLWLNCLPCVVEAGAKLA